MIRLLSPKVPQQQPTYNAVTLGAGMQWGEVYKFVDKQGRSIVGSVSLAGGTVGAACWSLEDVVSAGQSTLSPKFGLGVDKVLQFTIVTASSFQPPDSFWALRG